ncbi:MAG: hypothetical protein ACUVXI_01975 [bacterium]
MLRALNKSKIRYILAFVVGLGALAALWMAVFRATGMAWWDYRVEVQGALPRPPAVRMVVEPESIQLHPTEDGMMHIHVVDELGFLRSGELMWETEGGDGSGNR